MKKILVPTDFSHNANQALKYAVLLAQDSDAEIIVLHVYNMYVPVDESPMLRHTLSTVKLKRSIQEFIPEKVKNSYVCEPGNPIEIIVQVAQNIQADLIVMGIRGCSKLSQIIIGSTTTSLLRNIKIPVFVIPEKTESEIPARILFAYDGRNVPTKQTMQPLTDLSNTFKAKILTLNVLSPVEAEIMDKEYVERETSIALKGADYSVHFAEDTNVLRAIDEFIDAENINCVTMIYHQVGFLNRLVMESRTHKMAFYTRKPLLVLPEINA